MSEVFRHLFAVILVLVGVGFATWQVARRPPTLERAQAGWAAEYGAYLDPSFLRSLYPQSRRSRWLSSSTTLVLTASGAVVVWQTDLAPALVMAPIISVFLVLESARRLAAAGREFVVPGSRSAVARPRRVVLSDYVPRAAQLLTWAAVAIATIGAGSALVVDGVGATAILLVTTGMLAILVAAAFTAWFGNALCARPTPAVDASHLYLQDAWRAQSLTGTYSQLRLSAILFTQAIAMTAPGLGGGLSLGLMASGVVVLLADVGAPSRHFRRRLWPTLQPSQVLLPGQPVPPRIGANA